MPRNLSIRVVGRGRPLTTLAPGLGPRAPPLPPPPSQRRKPEMMRVRVPPMSRYRPRFVPSLPVIYENAELAM